MAEYINREEAMYIAFKSPFFSDSLMEEIMVIPAADVTPVRHGRWERVIPSKSAAKWSTKVSCSNCHNAAYTRYKYCPNCGTKMDLEG